jgi:hypothetical protein
MSFHGYKSHQKYMDHLYDVTYLANPDQQVVLHLQESGKDRVEVITKVRKQLGPNVYLVSCTKHAQDLNPIEMEML